MRLGGHSGKQASRVLGRTQTYFAGVGTLRVHFPGIPKVHGVLFQLEAAAGEVIVLDAIKIPAQATHPLLTDKMRSIVSVVNLGANSLTPGERGSRGQRGGRLVRGRGGRQRDKDGDPEADQGDRQSRFPAEVSPRLPHAAPLKAKQRPSTKSDNPPPFHSPPRAEVKIRPPWPWQLQDKPSLSPVTGRAEREVASTSRQGERTGPQGNVLVLLYWGQASPLSEQLQSVQNRLAWTLLRTERHQRRHHISFVSVFTSHAYNMHARVVTRHH